MLLHAKTLVAYYKEVNDGRYPDNKKTVDDEDDDSNLDNSSLENTQGEHESSTYINNNRKNRHCNHEPIKLSTHNTHHVPS